MRLTTPIVAIAVAFASAFAAPPGAFAQERPSSESKAAPKPTQYELEAKFKATLTKAVMSGRWCSIKDGARGAEKEDKYNIVSATKVEGEKWIISAKIKVQKQE